MAAEVTRATNAESVLTTNLATETTNRTNADATITTNLNNEVTRATTAEGVLATNLATEVSRATIAETTKEDAVNKSTDGTFTSNSDTRFPTEKATKTYVDASILSNTTPNATAFVPGKMQLAGDLAGTATAPVIAAGSIDNNKISATAAIADTKLATISTAGKVSNSATTATNANTANTIVARDASGNFNAGTITATSYVKSGGTSSQFLKADGSVDANTYLTSSSVSSTYLPLAGGTLTGSLNGTTATFATDIVANGIKLGIGTGSVASNLAIGNANFASNTTGNNNIAIGQNALNSNQTGSSNTVIGNGAVYYNSSSNNITAIGWHALHAEQGAGNTAVGYNTGSRGPVAATLTNSTFLGNSASAGGGTIDNATAIGNGTSVDASNKIQLGNTSVTIVNTSGKLTTGAVTYPNTDGTSGQVLTTNGSGIVSWTTVPVREVADEFTATATQTSFTLTQTKSANSKVKMFISGIRISNASYSVSGTTLTYIPANNGGYSISTSDRVQFDYYY